MAWYEMKGAGLPAGLQAGMDSVLNKKFGTSTTYAPATWPDNVNLLGPLPIKTASGAVAAFSDGADDVPISDCKFSFSPKQASGTPSPSNPLAITGWSGLNIFHGKKNLIDTSASAWESGTINSSGQNASGSGKRTTGYFDIKGGSTFTLSGITAPSQNSDFRVFFYDENKDFISYQGYRTEFTVPSNACFFRVRNISVDDISSLQFEYGSTATAYSAYAMPETKAVTWTEQGTIYGGYVTPNKVVKTWSDSIALNTLEWYKVTVGGETYFMAYLDDGNLDNTKIEGKATTYLLDGTLADKAGFFVSDGSTCAVYIRDDSYSTAEDFTANVTGNITYLLETPIEYDITALNLATYYGDNNFWSEGDTAEVQYRADIALALAALQGNRSLGLMTARPDPEEPEEDPEEPEER